MTSYNHIFIDTNNTTSCNCFRLALSVSTRIRMINYDLLIPQSASECWLNLLKKEIQKQDNKKLTIVWVQFYKDIQVKLFGELAHIINSNKMNLNLHYVSDYLKIIEMLLDSYLKKDNAFKNNPISEINSSMNNAFSEFCRHNRLDGNNVIFLPYFLFPYSRFSLKTQIKKQYEISIT